MSVKLGLVSVQARAKRVAASSACFAVFYLISSFRKHEKMRCSAWEQDNEKLRDFGLRNLVNFFNEVKWRLALARARTDVRPNCNVKIKILKKFVQIFLSSLEYVRDVLQRTLPYLAVFFSA